MSDNYFDKPIDDAIVNGLLHLPVAGKQLQMAAYQVRLALRTAGYEIRKTQQSTPSSNPQLAVQEKA